LNEDFWVRFGDCSESVIGACIEVHRALGPGLLESAYELCLAHELGIRGLKFVRQVPITLEFKGLRVECAYRADFVVEGQVLVEIKAVEKVMGIHKAQVITYLKLTGVPQGLLVNFNAETIRSDLRRLRCRHRPTETPP
jgi:GxxExxY protein